MSSCFIRGFAWILAAALIVGASSDASQAGGFYANDTSPPSTTHAVIASRAVAPNNTDPASNAPVIVKLDSEPKGRAAAAKSGFVLFNDKSETLVVEGLQNRTTLVLVSRRGAHARLIWERPATESGKPEKKTKPELAVLWTQDLSQYLEPEVLAMKGRPGEGAKGVAFGDRSGDGRAVGMTAFLVAGIMPAGGAHQQILFNSKVNRLAKQLLSHFGDIQFQIVAYPPLETVDINRAPWGVNDVFKSTSKPSPGGGKLVLEYQPAKSRGEKASWRLKIDEANVKSGTAIWDPTEVQVARAPEKQARWLSRSSFIVSDAATTLPSSSRQTSSLGTPSLRKKWVADNKAPVTIDRNSRSKEPSAVPASSTTPCKPPPPPSPESKPPPSLLDGKPPPPPPSKTFLKSGKTTPPEPDQQKGEPTNSAPQGPPTGPFVTDMRDLRTRERSSKEDKDPEPTTMLTTVKVTMNPNQESSKARPAKVVYYTPTAEPPKRPSSYQAPLSEPQDPEPSEAAYIYFEWNEYTDFYEGDQKPSAQWQMLPRTLDNMYHIICRVTPVASVLATVKEPTRSPGRPPSFSAVTDIWGRHNCKYTGGRAEEDPGKFSCDGVPEFDCYADPQEGEGINCSTEAGQERYYIPRVRCEFPAGKKTRVSHSDKNNNGGWRPIPESWGV